MPRLNISILHLLPACDALVQMRNLITSLQLGEKRISHISQKWNDNEAEFTLMFKRFTMIGSIKVEGHLVIITAHLPLGLYFCRGDIHKVIKDTAARLLSERTH